MEQVLHISRSCNNSQKSDKQAVWPGTNASCPSLDWRATFHICVLTWLSDTKTSNFLVKTGHQWWTNRWRKCPVKEATYKNATTVWPLSVTQSTESDRVNSRRKAWVVAVKRWVFNGMEFAVSRRRTGNHSTEMRKVSSVTREVVTGEHFVSRALSQFQMINFMLRMCVVCEPHAYMHAGGQKRESDLLELEVQVLVSAWCGC